MIAISWNRIESLKTKLESEVSDDEILVIKTQIDQNPPKLNKAKFQDLLKFMWTLYDHRGAVNSIKILKKDNNKILFNYEKPKRAVTSSPKSGNPNIVTQWKHFSAEKKEVLLKILAQEIHGNGTD